MSACLKRPPRSSGSAPATVVGGVAHRKPVRNIRDLQARRAGVHRPGSEILLCAHSVVFVDPEITNVCRIVELAVQCPSNCWIATRSPPDDLAPWSLGAPWSPGSEDLRQVFMRPGRAVPG